VGVLADRLGHRAATGGSRDAAYRGVDRRGLICADRHASRRSFLLTGLVLLSVVVLIVNAPSVEVEVRSIELISAQLDAAALVLALLLAALCTARWRLVGEAGLLWLAAAVTVYALSVLGAGHVLPPNLSMSDASTVPFRILGSVVALVTSFAAVVAHEVDTTLTPARVTRRLALLIASTVVVFALTPATFSIVPLVGTISWASLATYTVWRGLRGQRPLLAWAGLLFFSLALAELFVHVTPADPIAGLAPPLLRTVGFLCALVGGSRDLARIHAAQSERLLESRTSQLTAEVRMQAELADQAERAHEATNALAAIEAATLTLQRYRDALDPSSRDELSRAVSAEVRRLQGLVAHPSAAPGPGRFRVVEALAALVTCARSQGARVELDVPGHLVAIGNPAETAQVLQNLFQNAHRYAGGEVRVSACLEGEQVTVRVEDDGPGIPAHERERIFERGVRGAVAGATDGTGLGLYVSARLMRDQGGALRLEERPGGGACFAVSLPGFSELRNEPNQKLDGTVDLPTRGRLKLASYAVEPADAAVPRSQGGQYDEPSVAG
jgi:signal transduction histidine kinase